MSCRCPSCGYVHIPTTNDQEREAITYYTNKRAEEIEAERAADAREVVDGQAVDPGPQQTRCPLCGNLFDQAAEYDAHRARNCAPIDPPVPIPPVDPPVPIPPVDPPVPEVVAGAASGAPLVTEPNPANPAAPQE